MKGDKRQCRVHPARPPAWEERCKRARSARAWGYERGEDAGRRLQSYGASSRGVGGAAGVAGRGGGGRGRGGGGAGGRGGEWWGGSCREEDAIGPVLRKPTHALPALRRHLALHVLHHFVGKRDVSDLAAQALEAPRHRRRVDRLDD